jgi:phospholipid N-methyltransferase
MPDESTNWDYGEKVARLLMDAGYIKAGDHVLDFGAGAGRLVTPLLAAGCNVVAVEMNSDRRALLRDRNREAEREGRLTVYARGDVPQMQVDTTISFYAFQHMPLNASACALDDMMVWTSRVVFFSYPFVWRKKEPPSGYFHAHFDRSIRFDPLGDAPADEWNRFLWSDEVRDLVRHRKYHYANGFSKQHLIVPVET